MSGTAGRRRRWREAESMRMGETQTRLKSRLSRVPKATTSRLPACSWSLGNTPEVAARSVRFATAGQAHLEQGLGPPDVARLANAQLHQTGDAMLHHLT